MSIEVSFYQVESEIVKSIIPLISKILEENKKVLIFSKSQNQIDEIDKILWNYGKKKFIPHITIFDKDFDFNRQPILISNKEENTNDADYLLFLSDLSKDFVLQFQRAFYFFLSENIDEAKKISKIIHPANFYKKSEEKWVISSI